MKIIRIIFLLIFQLSVTIVYSQDFIKIDSIVLSYPEKIKSPEKLAKMIANDFKTDIEKVRAIYTWISSNVSYDYKEFGKYDYTYKTQEEYIKKEKKAFKKLSKRVILKKKAVCEGYAALFKRLSDILGIKSYIITGDSKVEIMDIGKRYKSDHVWNIAIINNKKYLFDTTWDYNKYKVKYKYFMTEPADFILNHYPDNYKNSLLDYKVKKEDYLFSPVIYDFNIHNKLELILPRNGILLKKNKIIKFNIKSKDVFRVSYYVRNKFSKIENYKINGDNLEFEIDISKLRHNQLIIYLNNKAVYGYRIK